MKKAFKATVIYWNVIQIYVQVVQSTPINQEIGKFVPFVGLSFCRSLKLLRGASMSNIVAFLDVLFQFTSLQTVLC